MLVVVTEDEAARRGGGRGGGGGGWGGYGKGDPLIQAFDGSLFFFHGEPGKIYTLASVADDFQVRAHGNHMRSYGAHGTYGA